MKYHYFWSRYNAMKYSTEDIFKVIMGYVNTADNCQIRWGKIDLEDMNTN